MGSSNADRLDVSVCKGEHHITRCNLPHEVIERVAATIPVALGRPQITARYLVAISLVLIDPPVAHVRMMPGDSNRGQWGSVGSVLDRLGQI